DEEVAEGSDDEVYCICRRPDNHSWMIACDGGCDDWFHGKCVRMREEQGELIDKYICPNCERAGKGVTTWKPGCRRPGCNKPALISRSKQSKYCSDECGKLFFQEKLGLDTERPSKKQKRKNNQTDHDGETLGVDVDEEDDIGPLGGQLRPGDVKALVSASSDAAQFRQLGDGVLSPPATASPDKPTSEALPTTNGDPTAGATPAHPVSEAPAAQPPSYTLTPAEHKRIAEIGDAQGRLTARRATLRDRERFVKMVVEQATRYAEKQGIKPKDVCGYDSRLAWGDAAFQKWGNTEEGKDALRRGTLGAAAATPLANGVDGAEEDKADAEGGEAGVREQANGGEAAEHTFCARKRCEQHRQWQKNELTIVRAELVDLGEEEAKLAKDERELRERAFRRWKGENSSNGKGGAGEASVEAMRADGWVEVL
ncbi:MAG: hypothetical protein INR71_10205, partial [Terriglobus roseus]|nr:hypothetical protein [Terriglobus roseus]